MNQIRKRLTYSNVMSTIAVFLVLGGATAFAAAKLGKNTVGSSQIKKNAVTTAKIKNGAVNSAKIGAGAVGASQLGAGAVTTDKLADGSVSGGKLADGSVTSGKLAESERSQAFQAVESGTQVGPLPALASSPLTVATLALPANGHYVVTAETELISTELSNPVFTQCLLSDEGGTIGEQFSGSYVGGLFPTGGITVSGVASGGTVRLACRSSDTTHTFSFQRRIIATRVASVN